MVHECEGLGHYTTVDLINTVHLDYTKFIKQHDIKSRDLTRAYKENDAIKRHSMYAALLV